MVEPAWWLQYYRSSSRDHRHKMRDVFVADFHTIADLRQAVEELFGDPEEKEIQDLLSSLIMALVKKRGENVPDRTKQRPNRRPRTRPRRQWWEPGDAVKVGTDWVYLL